MSSPPLPPSDAANPQGPVIQPLWHLLQASSLPPSSQGPAFTSPDSSRPGSSDAEAASLVFSREVLRERNALAVEQLRHALEGDAELAQEILGKYDVEEVGWCELVKLQPSKEGGYIQLSWKGANKFAVLQEVVLWARGSVRAAGEDCSHLCHQPRCRVLDHIIPEPSITNQSRKNCLVWVDCHHCPQKILVCPHEPPCIKHCPGFSSMGDFLQHGVCRVLVLSQAE